MNRLGVKTQRKVRRRNRGGLWETSPLSSQVSRLQIKSWHCVCLSSASRLEPAAGNNINLQRTERERRLVNRRTVINPTGAAVNQEINADKHSQTDAVHTLVQYVLQGKTCFLLSSLSFKNVVFNLMRYLLLLCNYLWNVRATLEWKHHHIASQNQKENNVHRVKC